jgi:hypothetical protein
MLEQFNVMTFVMAADEGGRNRLAMFTRFSMGSLKKNLTTAKGVWT